IECICHLLKLGVNSLLENNLECEIKKILNYKQHLKIQNTRSKDQIDELQKRLDITDKYKNFILFK
ncbi:unnamed protein product, partial [Rotaria sordida]